MTPLQIEIILHYYSRPTDYRDGDFTAPAVRSTIDDFKQKDVLIDATGTDRERTYRLGPRGGAFVQHLLSLELPVAVTSWVMQ